MTKKNYDVVKTDSKRLNHKRDYDARWAKIKRSKYPFTHFSKDFYHRKKLKVSAFDFWRLAKKQKLCCPLTGRRLTGETMSIDHIVPISKGGTNDLTNLQFVHVEVNYAKRNLLQENFIQLCHEVVKRHACQV